MDYLGGGLSPAPRMTGNPGQAKEKKVDGRSFDSVRVVKKEYAKPIHTE